MVAARFLLVLRHVADLPEIAQADDVLRVGRVRVGRIERHIALGGVDRLVIVALPVVGESAHHHRLARLFRIGMLAVDRLELLAGFLEPAGVRDWRGPDCRARPPARSARHRWRDRCRRPTSMPTASGEAGGSNSAISAARATVRRHHSAFKIHSQIRPFGAVFVLFGRPSYTHNRPSTATLSSANGAYFVAVTSPAVQGTADLRPTVCCVQQVPAAAVVSDHPGRVDRRVDRDHLGRTAALAAGRLDDLEGARGRKAAGAMPRHSACGRRDRSGSSR